MVTPTPAWVIGRRAGRLGLPAVPVPEQRLAGVLDRVAERARGPALHRVAVLVEQRELVVTLPRPLAALVIEQHDVVGAILVGGDGDLLALFTERLDNFGGLRAGAAALHAGRGVLIATEAA